MNYLVRFQHYISLNNKDAQRMKLSSQRILNPLCPKPINEKSLCSLCFI